MFCYSGPSAESGKLGWLDSVPYGGYLLTSMSCRALAVLDSTMTCLMTADFTDSESMAAVDLSRGQLVW